MWIHCSFLERGTKYPWEELQRKKLGAEMEGRTIQSLPHPGIHPLNNQETQTLLHMPERFCWQDPDIAISCKAMWVHDKYRSGCSQDAPKEGARESTQGLKGFCNPIGGTKIWTNQYSTELVPLVAYVAENGQIGHQWDKSLVKIICPSTGQCQGQELGVGGLGRRMGGGGVC